MSTPAHYLAEELYQLYKDTTLRGEFIEAGLEKFPNVTEAVLDLVWECIDHVVDMEGYF